MFEALFILTTIDAGTRIGRFLLQETLGRVYAPFARPDWLPGSLLASAVITAGWGYLIWGGSITTIWPMFGVANQALAVLALAVGHDLAHQSWPREVLLGEPAADDLGECHHVYSGCDPSDEIGFPRLPNNTTAAINIALTLFVMCSVAAVLLTAAAKWVAAICTTSMSPYRRYP